MVGALLAAEGTPSDLLIGIAREFSPRVEAFGPREVVLDLDGLTRLFGDARTLADELRRTAADRQVQMRIALAGTRTAARLLVRHRAGITIVEPGTEAAALAPLPAALLATLVEPPTPALQAFRQWGVRTLGSIAALPPADVAARLGQAGVEWQRRARGDDPRPLVPAVPEELFEEALDLEWPIEGLEPLSFVLGRMFEPLAAHLDRRGRGAAVLHVRLHLVTRVVHERSLQLPAPMRDPRTLRMLTLLDLESHPPAAAIDRVVVAVDPTPGRIVQFSLLTRPLPSPEQVSTLMARLTALIGEGRCGSPGTVDSWQPGAFAMREFTPSAARSESGRVPGAERVPSPEPRVALRRFRVPVPARVRVVAGGRPERIATDRRGMSGGRVQVCAGPWRTSGGWWAGGSDPAACARPAALQGWDRDEWDVALEDGATYRVFRERDSGRWYVDAIVD